MTYACLNRFVHMGVFLHKIKTGKRPDIQECLYVCLYIYTHIHTQYMKVSIYKKCLHIKI